MAGWRSRPSLLCTSRSRSRSLARSRSARKRRATRWHGSDASHSLERDDGAADTGRDLDLRRRRKNDERDPQDREATSGDGRDRRHKTERLAGTCGLASVVATARLCRALPLHDPRATERERARDEPADDADTADAER